MKSTEPLGGSGLPAPGPPQERTAKALTFSPTDLGDYADDILAPGGPQAIRVTETGGGGRSAVFVARHDDVVDVLTDEPEFSVRHYAKLFGAISPPGAYLLMRNESDERSKRYEILRAAKVHTPWFDEDPHVITPAIRTLSQRVVTTLVEAFRCRPQPQFDVLGEYGGYVSYLVACEVLGIRGPNACDPLAWLVTQASTAFKFRPFTPETTPYLIQTAWSQLVFAQLFADFENRQAPMRLLGRIAEASFRAHIRRRIGEAKARQPDPKRRDLLDALLLVKPRFDDVPDEIYEDHVLYLMLELVGTALTVPPMAFSGIAACLFGDGEPHLTLDDLTRENVDAFTDEALRLAPPAKFLLRNAAAGTEEAPLCLAGLKLREEEYVCALVGAGGRDVADGDQFRPGRPQSDYVHFGPEDGPHRCFGRPIALPMLGEMLLGLKSLEGLRPTGDVTNSIAGCTRRVVRFERGAPEAITPYYPRRLARAGEASQ